MKIALGMTCVALVLAGCGSGSSSSAGGKPTVSPTKAVVYAESATCRKRLSTFLDVAQANAQAASLTYSGFQDQYQRLEKSVDGALAACSPQVALPVRKAIVADGLASFSWGLCSVNSCPKAKIASHVQAAQASFKQARKLLSRSR